LLAPLGSPNRGPFSREHPVISRARRVSHPLVNSAAERSLMADMPVIVRHGGTLAMTPGLSPAVNSAGRGLTVTRSPSRRATWVCVGPRR